MGNQLDGGEYKLQTGLHFLTNYYNSQNLGLNVCDLTEIILSSPEIELGEGFLCSGHLDKNFSRLSLESG